MFHPHVAAACATSRNAHARWQCIKEGTGHAMSVASSSFNMKITGVLPLLVLVLVALAQAGNEAVSCVSNVFCSCYSVYSVYSIF